ncbi:hypothetical protein ILUMI_00616 [Ignelater luminosus]|uniref:Metallophosphoesterase n=1 Tax=Ignelater luminosus TaxID=2038154 RepID=A0A8K0DLY7_IGNLU|nr:hypothetical protein ILUMI_00616 [Ignelater luminosus]
MVKRVSECSEKERQLRKAITQSKKSPIKLTFDEALASFVQKKLTKNQYVAIHTETKTHNADIYPTYAELLLAKKRCYPENISVTKVSAEIHFPLFRDSDRNCNEPDEAPYATKIKPFKEAWDCLSKISTDRILRQINPRLVINGHTHHGCTNKLSHGDGLEITLPSFNWAYKNNPSYSLMTVDERASNKMILENLNGKMEKGSKGIKQYRRKKREDTRNNKL